MAMVFAGLLFGVYAAATGAQQRGVVDGVQPSASAIKATTPLSLRVTGRNPCGAVNINWGDGTAITYAITGLPNTQQHTYEYGGAYAIVARGMGNCDGRATTKVQVNGPAPPPSPSAEITAVKFSPMPAVARERTTISVEGRGTCTFSADYGDGNTESFSDELPRRVTHTYGAPDTYTVVIRPTPPCTGKFTQKLTVSPRNPTMVTDMRLGPSPAGVRQPVTIIVGGNGTCSYTIDYGDGNTEDRAKPLPDTLQHVYSAPDTYNVVATGSAGCEGTVRRVLTVQ